MVNQLLNRAPIIANSSVTSHTDASHTNHFQSSVSVKREGIDPDATPAERKAAAVARAANKKKDLEEERVLLKGKVAAVKALVEAGIFRAMRAEGHDDIKSVIVTKIPPV